MTHFTGKWDELFDVRVLSLRIRNCYLCSLYAIPDFSIGWMAYIWRKTEGFVPCFLKHILHHKCCFLSLLLLFSYYLIVLSWTMYNVEHIHKYLMYWTRFVNTSRPVSMCSSPWGSYCSAVVNHARMLIDHQEEARARHQPLNGHFLLLFFKSEYLWSGFSISNWLWSMWFLGELFWNLQAVCLLDA